MMKYKVLFFTLFFALFSFVFASCSCQYAVDAQISSLEESIEYLETNYKDLTPSELEKTLNQCEEKFDAIKNGDCELTQNQNERISNLKGRYHRLLLKIEIFTLKNEIFNGDTFLEYLRGLISGD